MPGNFWGRGPLHLERVALLLLLPPLLQKILPLGSAECQKGALMRLQRGGVGTGESGSDANGLAWELCPLPAPLPCLTPQQRMPAQWLCSSGETGAHK